MELFSVICLVVILLTLHYLYCNFIRVVWKDANVEDYLIIIPGVFIIFLTILIIKYIIIWGQNLI